MRGRSSDVVASGLAELDDALLAALIAPQGAHQLRAHALLRLGRWHLTELMSSNS